MGQSVGKHFHGSLSSRMLPVQLPLNLKDGLVPVPEEWVVCTYSLHFCIIVCHLWGKWFQISLENISFVVSLLEMLCPNVFGPALCQTHSSKTFQRDPVEGSSVYGTAGKSPALGPNHIVVAKRKPRSQSVASWNRLGLLDVGKNSKVRWTISKQVIKGWIQIVPRRHREQRCYTWPWSEGSGVSEEFFTLLLHSPSRFITVCYDIVFEFQGLLRLFAQPWTCHAFRICCTST